MEAVVENLPLYWKGFRTTLVLALVSGLIALVWGTILGAFRVSPVPPLRAFGTAYVEIVRNTPLTLVFFFFVFVWPQIGPSVPFFISAIAALSIYTASFVCEAVRSGINSVGVGQAEAARAVGLTFTQTLSIIIVPQALRTVVPPLINVFIALAKNTSVAGGFFVAELFGVARRLANAHPPDVIAVLIGVGIAYLVITIPAGVLAGYVERKVVFAR
ncbi:amino acid ABC transporter permease [Haloechinothrix sp. YIM 98757]|uniref:Amino acid ABC transporter permease n=1 Tax=Haloechinothrix aidingensis TaxID=2752311 RepID=A0A838A6X8_9PSEU|nr:amino acid ABC transporter permease [Haloechinothrix aidingensis]MBA0125680.1 amino acid ABC transporter permease [Haloechinothrix aidingensis]